MSAVLKRCGKAVLGCLKRFAVNKPANDYEAVVFKTVREAAVIFGNGKAKS